MTCTTKFTYFDHIMDFLTKIYSVRISFFYCFRKYDVIWKICFIIYDNFVNKMLFLRYSKRLGLNLKNDE